MPMGHKIRRQVTIGNPTCLLGFSGRDSVDSAVFDSSTLNFGGVNEVQTITQTGSPTGGTYKLGYRGQVTGNIAQAATAAAVQAALEALDRIGPGNVVVAGSNGGPYTVTFQRSLGARDVPTLTLAANALTGGTSPSVGIAETTKGNSQDAGHLVLHSGLPLMAAGNGKVKEWDYSDPTQLLGIFDGQVELLGREEFPIIPVYNHECVFDVNVVKNYAANKAKYDQWAAAHVCQFKSQGYSSFAG